MSADQPAGAALGPRLGAAARRGNSPAPPSRLAGRATELAALKVHLERALAGEGRLLLLAGEAGVGKTRLAQELLAAAAQAAAVVLEGACYPIGTSQPFAPFVAALRSALRAGPQPPVSPLWWEILQPLLPELAPGQSPGTRSARSLHRGAGSQCEAFYQVLCALARPAGLVLLLEDLHWADRASLELLHYLARGLRDKPLLLLATYRDDAVTAGGPLARLLAELYRTSLACELWLAPLDQAAIEELVAEQWPRLTPAARVHLADHLFRKTSGNAFFLCELLRWLAQTRQLAPEAGAGAPALPPAIPRSVQAVVAERLQELSKPAQALLTWAAVLGRAFDLRVLCHLVGDEEGSLTALRELVSRRLLEPAADADHFRFHHAIVQEAVYAQLLPLERRAAHRAVARAIEAVYPDQRAAHLAELAEHYERAGDLAQALTHTIEAGEWAAQMNAHGQAAAHFQSALALLDQHSDPARRPAVLEALAEARAGAGELAAAEHAYREALESYLARGEVRAAARIRARLAGLCMARHQLAAGLAHCEAGLALCAEGEAQAEVAVLWAMVARLRYAQGDYTDAIQAGRQALALAERLDDPRGIGEACYILIYLLTEVDDPAEAEALGQRGLMAAERSGDPILEIRTCHALGYLYGIVRQDLARGGAYLQRGLTTAQRIGHPYYEAWTLSMLARQIAFASGDWSRAESLVQQSLTLAERLGAHDVQLYATYCQGLLAHVRGDDTQALAHFDRILTEGAMGGHWRVVWASRYQRGVLLLEQGACEEALAALRAAVEQPSFPLASARASRLAEAYLLRGDLAQARHWAQRSLETSRALGRVLELVEAQRVMGLVAAAEGDLAAARTALETSCATLTRLERPYDRARHERDLAALLARAVPLQDLSRATALLTRAAATFAQLGAQRDLLRTRALARQHQLRLALPRPVDQAEPACLLGSLTLREREVARLVARGLTNRQLAAELVISEGTAALHVKRILRKLGLTSRVQLAALVAQARGAADAWR
ncbi:MAG TPA: AAA family ATPase [Chloroflexota bacterium]|nr:AAA family ATPase [Chloroflexota bacterium]